MSLRPVQSLYEVVLIRFPYDNGHIYRILLVWDHDRLWGSFDFGFCRGVMRVDPGPMVNDLRRYRKVPFIWRGICSDRLLNNPRFHTGAVRLDGWFTRGHFDDIPGVGRCDFAGEGFLGPTEVPCSLQSLNDEWNGYGNPNDEYGTARSPQHSEPLGRSASRCDSAGARGKPTRGTA